MIIHRFPFIFGTLLLAVLACSKNEGAQGEINLQSFKVYSINKDKGMGGDILEVNGSGFGTDVSVIDVKFALSYPVDTLFGDIVRITPNRLTIRVPYMYTAGNISIFIVKNELISDKFPFTCDIDAVDSISIVKSEWMTIAIKDGIIWKKTSFEAFQSRQNINVVEIDQTKVTEMGLLYSTPVGTRKRTSTFANQIDATVAINGSYYSTGKASIGHLRVKGVDVENGTNWNDRINASLVIKDNELFINYLGSGRYNETSRELSGEHVMACGPSLLVDGTYLKTLKPDDAHVLTRHPRTAVGITTSNKVLLVTVDGRQPNFSEGVNLRELSVVMRALKAKNAMNLDGGGSTTMYINGNGVVNSVSDASERFVANVLYIK